MSIYLIDYENVNLSGLSGIETLSELDRVYLFYGANPGYIPFEKHILIAKTPADVPADKRNEVIGALKQKITLN